MPVISQQPSSSNLFIAIAIAIAGATAATCYGYLAWLSLYSVVDLGQFWPLMLIAALACFGLFTYLSRTPLDIRSSQTTAIHILFWAVLFRLIGIIGEPILEDDIFRYLWDGYRFVSDGSPYGVAPALFFDQLLPEKMEAVLEQINHPQLTTVYGPVCQWLFALAYWIAPAEVWPLQVLFVVCDLVLIALLLKLANIRYVLLYAWCPLVIKEVAFTAHTDVVAVMFVLAAFYCFQKNSHEQQSRRQWVLPVFLALAVASKIFALLVVPLFLAARWKEWLLFSVVIFLIYLPFAIPFLNADAFHGFGNSGTAAMSSGWLFNAPIYTLLLPVFTPWLQTYSLLLMQGILLSSFTGLFVYYFWQKQRVGQLQTFRIDWLYGLFFLAIPFFNPWYWLWVLPYAVIKPSYWAWTASLMLLLSYGTGINDYDWVLAPNSLEAYQLPNHLLILEFGAIALALYFDWKKRESFARYPKGKPFIKRA